MAHSPSSAALKATIEHIVDAGFWETMDIIQTAQIIHYGLLVPYPRSVDVPLLASYPPFRDLAQGYSPVLSPEVQAYLAQLPTALSSASDGTDTLFPWRMRLIRAYQRALIRRTDRMTGQETRIDAPFPPMTTEEYQKRVAFVVDRARAIPIEQTVDWWADVTCGVALISPSAAALAALAAASPDNSPVYHYINGWRQIGYIVEHLQR